MNKGIKSIMLQEMKLAKEMANYRHKCKCGHTVILIKKQFIICSNCGHPIFRDEKAKFKYKLGGLKCLH